MKESLTLPAEEMADISPRSLPKPTHRILLADDDGDMRLLNADVLLRSGYEVDSAEDGAMAWDALLANQYHLLITDNNMPKVSGVELLKKLRGARMALPVIMATGTLPTWELAAHPWLLPAATLLKPYTTDELLATVRNVLRATIRPPREKIARLPDWQSQPSNNDLRL